MELKIEPYRCLPCSLQVFEINGIKADEEDFGETDVGGDCMEGECHCRFEKKLPTDEVLAKYGINLKEYAEICEELEETLYISGCGWCS